MDTDVDTPIDRIGADARPTGARRFLSRLRRTRKADRQTFVFIDDGPLWHSFHQTAALVRRQGCRTVRATTAPTKRGRRVLDRLLYSQRLYLSGVADLPTVASALKGANVANIYAVEAIMAAAPDDAFDEVSAKVAAEWRSRKKYCDKMEVATLAGQIGVRVPEQLPAVSVSVDDAIATLGLPLVVKVKIGAAGAGVVIARDEADVRNAVSSLGALDDMFFERFVSGPIVTYNAMIADSGVIQETTCRAITALSDPTQAPLVFGVIDDREMSELGRTLCDAIGLRGPANVQAILDEDGRHWMIDLNARPYGTMLSWDQDVLDTGAAFLYAMNLRDTPPDLPRARIGDQVRRFPNDAEDLARSGAYRQALKTYASRSPMFAPVLGKRYLAYTLLTGVAGKLGI